MTREGPPNNEMQLTRPVQIGASQLISSVRRLLPHSAGPSERTRTLTDGIWCVGTSPTTSRRESIMRLRIWATATILFLLGLAVGTLAPATRAQAPQDRCADPWVLQSGPTSDTANTGAFYAIKMNKCTGEAWALSDVEASGNAIMTQNDENKKITWRKYPVQ